MSDIVLNEGFLNKVFKKPEQSIEQPTKPADKMKEQLAKLKEMQAKADKANANADKTLNTMNAKLGLSTESYFIILDYIEDCLNEATHEVNGRTVRGNSLRTSFAAKDEIENREDKAASELDIPKVAKLAKVSDKSNEEMIKLFDDKYVDALHKMKELSKSNDPKDKEEFDKARQLVKKLNNERKEKMLVYRGQAKKIGEEPHYLSALYK